MGKFGLRGWDYEQPSSDSDENEGWNDTDKIRGAKKSVLKGRKTVVPPISFSDFSDSSNDDQDTDEPSDSEDEQWPVGSRRNRHGRGLYVPDDEWDHWNQLQQKEASFQVDQSFSSILRENMSLEARKRQQEIIEAQKKSETELGQVTSMLQQLEVQRSDEQKRIALEFEKRNKELWDNINAAIEKAEKEKEAALAAARKKQEEQELKARAMRELEEKKLREEEEARRAEAAKKEAEELKAKEEAAKREAELAKLAEKTGMVGPDKDYERWRNKINYIKSDVLPAVSNNQQWRKACHTAKRQITLKIGQITNEKSQILQVAGIINNHLIQLRSVAQETYIWGLNHLSKALIKQAELEVEANQSVCYPLARVVIHLLSEGHEDFGEVLMARLVKKCFWICGYCPPKTQGMTAAEHSKLLGYNSAEESTEKYQFRMFGIISVWAAIIQTRPNPGQAERIPEYFRPRQGWRWLALMTRSPLVKLEGASMLLVAFFDVSGERFGEVYQKQFWKLIRVLLEQGIKQEKAGFTGNRARTVKLEITLEKWLKNSKIEGLSGREMDL